MSNTTMLILVTILGIALLLFLVMRSKLQAFVALLISSIFIGVLSGMDLNDLIATMEEGMGGTLGFIAVVVGLGAMFGEMLRVSGGAERLALTLVNKFGDGKVQWALGLTGFIVAIPVFLDVALVILIPIVYSLAQKTKKSLLYFGIPLLAGLAVTHSFIPPTPGPISVASIINADLGWVILFGAIAGLPAMIIAGPIFGKYISKKIHLEVPKYIVDKEYLENEVEKTNRELPSFKTVCLLILIPLFLILINTVFGLILEEGTFVHSFLTFIGHPFIALTISTLLTFYILGTKRGYTKEEVQNIATKSLEPAGIIILITGAGGVFKQTLIDSGVGDVLGNMLATSNLPLVLAAFIISTFVRIAQGSATVAMITAAGLMSPIINLMEVSEPMLGLIVISIASGATVFSHVNDSGFWLVNRFFGMTEKQTLQTWTVMETIIGFVGFAVVFAISFFV
ncbi:MULTISPECIES: gluconate:H+ symporter [Oceanobacillus]|uniref:Gluconate transporter n=1 Tax=Oceanobacillus kimchii TaxID=746691 RepID=A0ABQ5TM95_9BACI|nr:MULTISPECIES: gluconate:H+ symporter [Oceanobacillus]MBT2600785.1 gluconate transporter [Oceanobacillus sp. ISL-74]MBT2650818.1 gluconate transporter [Oceanobacillus sp. ISL-73]MCT1575540.1 GntP family permease [Oceanobacillus kimchii]MCT2137171.1 GntP family permease [Oceanobacillus kimchii]OEH55356.1 gluconate transporter [Oceanobacillus sp. E9]